jgi:hypothetical protein
VLATNIDILFADELIAYIAAGKLEPHRLYRIDRHDVMPDVPYPTAVTDQLAWCRSHLLRVNAREGTFRLTPDGAFDLASPDVVSANLGIRFGRGWYPPENNNGEVSRWAADRAELIVRHDGTLPRTLCLELEPGPGVGQEPFPLAVRAEDGSLVASGTVRERQLVSFRLPEPAAAVERFVLQVPGGGGQPMPNDWRVMNYRVFDCQRVEDWQASSCQAEPEQNFRTGSISPRLSGGVEPHDIVAPDRGVRFGPGWHPVEEYNGRRFRWAADEAVLVVSPPAASEALTLAIEPGPGVAYGPFDLHVIDEGGERLQSTRVDGPSLATLQLPRQAHQTRAYTLRVEGGGRPAVNDTRVLNFRVLHPVQNGGPHLRVRARLLARKLARRLARWLPGVLTTATRWRSRRRFGKPLPGPAELPAPAAPSPSPDEPPVSPVSLHLNASGDFTLLAREHWCELGGYPELEIFSLHLDSVFCFMAHHAGCAEVILPEPMRIYHLEHGAGSGWTPEGADQLMQRIEKRAIPVLSIGELVHWAAQMRRQNAPIRFNDADWGLADQELREQRMGVDEPAVTAPPR